MIVRYIDDRTLLITQPDHARLAAEVMTNCAALEDHERRDEILHAIATHDDGWTVEDENPSIDPATGEVADFVRARTEVRQGVWPRVVGALAEAHPWAATLVAHHAITVYTRLRANPDWHVFFSKMGIIRDTLLKKSGLRSQDLEADYVYLRLGDLISLTFCTGSTEPTHFAGHRLELFRDRLIVQPDLFGGMDISVSVPVAELAEKKYKSDKELRAAMRTALPSQLVGTVSYR